MDFQEWAKTIPFFTRHYMIGALVVAATLSFNLINPEKLILTYEGVFENYYFWTILTNYLVVGSFSFQFLLKMYLIYYAVGNTEKFHTPNKYADFVYMILVCMGLVWIYSLIVGKTYYMSDQLVLSLLYIYCKREPLHQVRFMFGFVFKNAYLPWVILVYELLTNQPVLQLLIGIAAGHTYIVLKDVLPNSPYKYNLLETPNFVKKLVDKYGPQFPTNNFGGFGAGGAQGQGAQPERPQQFRFFRGQGVRIG